MHLLDTMHREINQWARTQRQESWIVVRQQALSTTHTGLYQDVKVVGRGKQIGSYKEQPIVDLLMCEDGSVFEFASILPDLRQIEKLDVGMRVTTTELVYRQLLEPAALPE